jgi:hypothetical protein
VLAVCIVPGTCTVFRNKVRLEVKLMASFSVLVPKNQKTSYILVHSATYQPGRIGDGSFMFGSRGDHPDTLYAMHASHKGLHHHDSKGRYNDANRLFEQLLTVQEEQLWRNTLDSPGRRDNAGGSSESKRRCLGGSTHSIVLTSVYGAQGRYNHTETSLRRAVRAGALKYIGGTS